MGEYFLDFLILTIYNVCVVKGRLYFNSKTNKRGLYGWCISRCSCWWFGSRILP